MNTGRAANMKTKETNDFIMGFSFVFLSLSMCVRIIENLNLENYYKNLSRIDRKIHTKIEKTQNETRCKRGTPK